jgi:hypothetical protein
MAQCEECRLALVRVVFDPDRGEIDGWACQLDETFSDRTREVECPFHVSWLHELPPPARSCKKSKGQIDGCSTSGGSCGSCGSGGCGSGGCGMGDPAEALDTKWDPEEVAPEPADLAAGQVAEHVPEGPGHPDEPLHGHGQGHDDQGHDDHHDHGPEPVAPDGGTPIEGKDSCATACGALRALDRMGLGRDEDAPTPVPLDEADD